MNIPAFLVDLRMMIADGAKAIYIPVNGEIEAKTPENGTDFQLRELQAFVDDGYCNRIEIVHLPYDGWILVINEEGKLTSEPEVNLRATALAQPGLMSGDFIAGHALLCRDEMVR